MAGLSIGGLSSGYDHEMDLRSRLALSAAFEPGQESVGQLVAEYGAVETVSRLSCPSSGTDVSSGTDRLTALHRRWAESDWIAKAERELDRAAELGVTFLIPGTPGWPTQLDDLSDRAPLALRVKGSLSLRTTVARSVAVVGARAATRYGEWVAEEACAELAANDWCVVSGGALGIDAASHRGALAGQGPTVAVSAAGVDLPTPPSNGGLFARLYDDGAVVSEVPLGAPPNRRRFLVRNRIIAALTPVVVVVEAALRSGALSTAREADAMGRMLCAFPGPTTSAMSAGCHRLIREGGASLVTCADDIVQAALSLELRIGWDAGDPARRLSDECQCVLNACTSRSSSIDAIAGESGLARDEVQAILHILERESLVQRAPKGWKLRERDFVGEPG